LLYLSRYRWHNRNTPADSQVPYLKTVFAFLGMTDVEFIYAEGLAMGPQAEQQALAGARAQIDALLGVEAVALA
jgi:FMN-dependent NADH-azoreductase